MVQIINQRPSVGGLIGDLLGGAAGGVASGAAKGLQHNVQEMYDERKHKRVENHLKKFFDSPEGKEFTPKQQEVMMLMGRNLIPEKLGMELLKQNQVNTKELKSLSQDFPKIAKDLMGQEFFEALSPEERLKFQDALSNRYKETGDVYDSMRYLQEVMTNSIRVPTQEVIEKNPGLLAFLAEGFKEGFLGDILGIEATDDEIKERMSQDESFANEVMQALGQGASDLPLLAGGNMLGGPIGAMMVQGAYHRGKDEIRNGDPQAVTGALKFFGKGAALHAWQSLSPEGRETWKKDAEAGTKFLEGSMKDAAMGWIFKKIPGVKKLLKKVPALKKILENSIGSSIFEIAAGTTAIGGAQPILEGRTPTPKDFLSGLATTFGFKILDLGGPVKKRLLDYGKKSGKSAPEFAREVETKLSEKGFTAKQIESGNAEAITALERSAQEVAETAKSKLETREPTHKDAGELATRTAEEKRIAERVSKEPIDKVLDTETSQQKKIRKELDKLEIVRSKEGEKLKALEEGSVAGKTKSESSALLKKAAEKQKANLEKVEREIVELKEDYKTAYPPKETTEVIQERIKSHNEDLRRAAESPGSELDKKIEADFSRDQKYLAKAAQALSKGSLPEPSTMDRYIEVNNMYNDSYRDLIKKTKGKLEEIKGKRGEEIAKERKDLKGLLDRLERNVQISDAKLMAHKPKRFIRETLRHKGKPFLKKYLQDLGAKSKALEKDFFEYKKSLNDPERKIARVGKERLKSLMEKVARGEKGSEKAAEKLSEETGVPKEEIQQAQQVGKKVAKKASESIKKGLLPEKFQKFFEEDLKTYREKDLPKIARGFIGGIIIGGMQEGMKTYLGISPSFSALAYAIPGTRAIRFGGSIMWSITKQAYRKALTAHWKKEMQAARTPARKMEIIHNLKSKGWSKSQINQLSRTTP